MAKISTCPTKSRLHRERNRVNAHNPQALGASTVIAAVQSLLVTVGAPTDTFTMSFNGSPPSSSVTVGSATLASDIAIQLNNLPTIGGDVYFAGCYENRKPYRSSMVDCIKGVVR